MGSGLFDRPTGINVKVWVGCRRVLVLEEAQAQAQDDERKAGVNERTCRPTHAASAYASAGPQGRSDLRLECAGWRKSVTE